MKAFPIVLEMEVFRGGCICILKYLVILAELLEELGYEETMR